MWPLNFNSAFLYLFWVRTEELTCNIEACRYWRIHHPSNEIREWPDTGLRPIVTVMVVKIGTADSNAAVILGAEISRQGHTVRESRRNTEAIYLLTCAQFDRLLHAGQVNHPMDAWILAVDPSGDVDRRLNRDGNRAIRDDKKIIAGNHDDRDPGHHHSERQRTGHFFP